MRRVGSFLARRSGTPPAPAPVEAPRRAILGPDPRQMLSSIGAVLYDWDIVTDRLPGGRISPRRSARSPAPTSTGRAYGERLGAESAASRYEAIFSPIATDEGDGVPYHVVYALAPAREFGAAPLVWVEDTGRWFAGADGSPRRAHGVVRVVTDRHELERELASASQIDPLTGGQPRPARRPCRSAARPAERDPQALRDAAGRAGESVRAQSHLRLRRGRRDHRRPRRRLRANRARLRRRRPLRRQQIRGRARKLRRGAGHGRGASRCSTLVSSAPFETSAGADSGARSGSAA